MGCLSLFSKMHRTFQEWQNQKDRARNERKGKTYDRTTTSRVHTTHPTYPVGSDGIASLNQVMRESQLSQRRPASEVGSIRSFRSVMTVEEQVGTLERKVEELETKIDSVQAQSEKTNQLLVELLNQTKRAREDNQEPAKVAPSTQRKGSSHPFN